jgi:hypothetical protein
LACIGRAFVAGFTTMVVRGRRVASMAFVIVAVACGGADDGPLYTGSHQSGGTGGAAGSSGSTGGLAGAPSGGQAGTSTGGAAGAAVGGAAGDASGGTTASGGTSGSGGTGSGGTSGVGNGSCGANVCAFAAGDACCIAQNVGVYCSNDSLSNPCECKGIGCDTTVIHCDGPEDCAGKICCAQKPFLSSTYDEVACVETCQSDQVVGATRKIVCHPGGAPCPQNAACQSDSLLPAGYGTCATP